VTKDFDKQLSIFSVAETREWTELYFDKYWLDGAEYSETWLPIQNSVFDSRAKHLPDLMFNPNFELLPLIGLNVFTSDKDFAAMQACMKQTGDKYFAVVQNKNVVVKVYYGEHGEDDWRVHPLLRFRFPVDISWDELMSGGYVSTELFQGAAKDYFVFGDSGNWGRYVANSYANPSAIPMFSTPLNIMGFRPEFVELFRESFDEVRRLEPYTTPEILLPDSYKQLPGSSA
jgi:hypothetical protein